MVTKRVNPYTSFTFGALLTTRFGKPLVLPMLGYTHKKNKWTTKILLPALAYIRRESWGNTKIGLKMTIESNVHNADFRDYSFNSNQTNRLAYTRILIGPEVLIPIYKDLFFQIRGGLAFRNIYDTQDDDLNNGLSFDANERLYLKFGIIVLK